MKNLFILPTDKPTGIFQSNSGLQFSIRDKVRVEPLKGFHIYITSDEEIKKGDWCINLNSSYEHKELCRIDNQIELERYAQKIGNDCKKIILTTDQDLIADGVQAIPDEFLEWFVKNPSCEFVKIHKEKQHIGEEIDESYPKGFFAYKIIIPKEEPKQETLEEAAEMYKYNPKGDFCFTKGANYQAKRMYSKEEVINIVEKSRETGLTAEFLLLTEQFKKK
jgi:hypothetical protein